MESYAQDQAALGKVVDYRVAIEEEAFAKAIEKGRVEKLVLKTLQSNGMSSTDAFRKFGIM